MVLLAFTAGILVTVLYCQGNRSAEGRARSADLSFIGGFALFTFLSGYLG